MHPIFIAAGPAFRKSFTIEKQFETVDIYSLVCFVLGVEPHENEGDFERISQILSKSDRNLGEDLTRESILLRRTTLASIHFFAVSSIRYLFDNKIIIIKFMNNQLSSSKGTVIFILSDAWYAGEESTY